jgi:hypothetical protein
LRDNETVCGECFNEDCDDEECQGQCAVEDDYDEDEIPNALKGSIDRYGLEEDDIPWTYICPKCEQGTLYSSKPPTLLMHTAEVCLEDRCLFDRSYKDYSEDLIDFFNCVIVR